MRYVIAGTAGHIDHGKSALVKALTGTDPDRLKEEKERGITIDLGFAHLGFPDVQIGFVDVPGHEKFVKNMLAGVGGIDLVLLVVAADESIMPQTREHFEICRLLGIRSGVVAITKSDLADPDLVELVREEIGAMVAGSFLEGAPVLAVSSRTGEGVQALGETLRGCAERVHPKPLDRILRLPVDRAFSIHGFGTVVTGTLTGGVLQRDQEVQLIPDGPSARVRGIQVHGASAARAVAGQRTAVNLQGVDLTQVTRGMVLTAPRRFQPTRMLDVRIDLLPSAKPLKNLIKVRLHQGTAEVLARAALLGREVLEPGESCYAQLRLDSPIFCLHGDAFIIRQFSPTVTIGGGRVLNPHPSKHRSTDRETVRALEGLDRGTTTEKIPILLGMLKAPAADLNELNSLLGIGDAELKAACVAATSCGSVVTIPGPARILVLPSVMKELRNRTVALLTEFHTQNALSRGVSREELRKRVFDDFPAEVFRYCLENLVAEEAICLLEETVSLRGHEVQLSTDSQLVRDQIEAIYREAGFQPPLFSELAAAVAAAPDEVKRMYFWMLKEKTLIRVSEELAYHRVTLDEIREAIRARFAPGDRFGVAEFKEMFDLTRKHAIPLLEYLDRERFTRRQGNERILL